MKRLIRTGLIVALSLIMCFALGCGSAPDDPNCGVYNCTTVEAMGYELSIDDVLENGASLELKGGGKADIVLDGESYGATWSYEGSEITITADDVDSVGTMENGRIDIDLMDMGMTYHFVKEGMEDNAVDAEEGAEAEEEPAEEAAE